MSFYTYCCEGSETFLPVSSASAVASASSLSSSSLSISGFDNFCYPCEVFPKRFGFTSTAGNFLFNSVFGRRHDCGGWDQYNELIHDADANYSIGRQVRGLGQADVCAMWRTVDRAINTNKTDWFGVPLVPQCPHAVSTPRWELLIRTNGGNAFAELYCFHFGDFVFGTTVVFWHLWASAALVPLPGSNCVIDIACNYANSFSGFPTPTYTTNNTIAPSFTLVPT